MSNNITPVLNEVLRSVIKRINAIKAIANVIFCNFVKMKMQTM